MFKLLWRIAEGARAAWEWWGLLAVLGVVPGVPIVLGLFEGQPWSVLALYVVTALAFWIVLATEGKAILDERKKRRSPVARLMALRAEGVEILNRYVRDDGDVMRHIAVVDEWNANVSRVLREVGAPDSDVGW